ncbi:hypothetical protein FMK67_13055 [Klebsiella michiganensis]|uniref:Uncharacterized protein n=1 Tax=Raoultella planticola TaxID=575 RepID=A0A443VSM9_RAOPL|nr:hypothetical protein C2U46_30125 [Klebsiella oxytoca]MBZ6666381.1 hypothetical protein [Klebsiella michiganensis]MBZ7362868.1 hypothetical protein [Klebsiella grimontii]RWT25132.1 hypothetical protein DN603_03245 [Raoultella planticola]THE40998.1 hypothetical protein DJ495_14105 [Raoultella ornithinolytica]
MVARSGRRCAAVDVGGFGAASSHDITPMRHIIRASSPHELAHAVWCRGACFPAHGRTAAIFFVPDVRPAFSPNTVGRIDGAMSWGELLTKEAS